MNARLGPAAAAALTLLLAWLVLYPILVVVADAAAGGSDAVTGVVTRPGEWGALGAGRWDTLARVTLPLLRPALAGAGLLVFMAALGSFSAPYVFGGGFRVMTTQIVATKLNGELSLAMVETVALALVAVVGFAVLRRTEGNDPLIALGKGTAPRRRPIRRPGVRGLATAAGWLVAVLLLLPHLTLALRSLVPYRSWATETLPPVLSLRDYPPLVCEPERPRPPVNSPSTATAQTLAYLALA